MGIMQSIMNNSIVIKLGGSIYDSRDGLITDIIRLQKEGHPIVIIHGGASMITNWLEKQDCKSSFFEGQRITDSESLDIVTAVLAGLVNKEIVATIINAGGEAIGVSGVDGGLIQGKIKDLALGYVGSIVKINTRPLTTIIEAGFIPVIAPVSFHFSGQQEGERSLLNVNGDTAAGAIAAELKAGKMIFLTDVDGIKDHNNNLITSISTSQAQRLIDSGTAYGGMIPKIRACLDAAANKVTQCSIINGNNAHALYREATEGNTGTSIYQD